MQSRWSKVAAMALLAASGLALAQPRSPSQGQEYPTRPVRLVNPYTPGGSVDLVGRALAAGVTEIWGQEVIVEFLGGRPPRCPSCPRSAAR